MNQYSGKTLATHVAVPVKKNPHSNPLAQHHRHNPGVATPHSNPLRLPCLPHLVGSKRKNPLHSPATSAVPILSSFHREHHATCHHRYCAVAGCLRPRHPLRRSSPPRHASPAEMPLGHNRRSTSAGLQTPHISFSLPVSHPRRSLGGIEHHFTVDELVSAALASDKFTNVGTLKSN
jgi:hypothetical protein